MEVHNLSIRTLQSAAFTFVDRPSLVDLQLRSDRVVSSVEKTSVDDEMTKLTVELQLLSVIVPERLQFTRTPRAS